MERVAPIQPTFLLYLGSPATRLFPIVHLQRMARLVKLQRGA